MKSKMIQRAETATSRTNVPARDIRSAIDGSSHLLVASHVDPDGDAIGTQLAFAAHLRQLDKQVWTVRETDIPAKYRFLPDVETIRHVDSLPPDLSVDTVVILECPNRSRIGQAARYLDAASTVINIDHHRDSRELGTLNWIDPARSSVGEMVYEYLVACEHRVTSPMATQLYTAIMTDTGRFRFNSTSPRTMEIAGELIALGADPKEICDQVYYNLDPSTMRLTALVLNTIEFHNNGSVCLLTLTKDMLERAQADPAESDGLVDFSLFTRGVKVGALLKERDSESTRVSFRSRDGVNVAELASRFGGGGHFNAAGCTVPMGLQQAKRALLDMITEVQDE